MESHQFSRTKRNNCILPLQQDRHNKNWQQKLSIGISTTSTIANKNWKTHFLHGMNQFIDFSFLTSHLVPFPGLNRKIQKYLHPIISKVFTWLGRIAWNAFLDYRDASKRHTCIYSQRMYDNIYIYIHRLEGQANSMLKIAISNQIAMASMHRYIRHWLRFNPYWKIAVTRKLRGTLVTKREHHP